MKVVELLRIGREILKTLQDSCVRLDDYKYLNLYDEYCKLKEHGNKISYAVTFLSQKYGISERKVYYLINRFESDCKTGAV